MPILKDPRHELFAQSLVKGKTKDEAYREAGFKPHRGNAARLSANESVQRRVRELLQHAARRTEASVARTLEEMARLAFSDIRLVLDEQGRPMPLPSWPDHMAAAVQSVEYTERRVDGEADEQLDPAPGGGALRRRRNARVDSVTKIKLWSKPVALTMLARHLGMFDNSGTGRNTALPASPFADGPMSPQEERAIEVLTA